LRVVVAALLKPGCERLPAPEAQKWAAWAHPVSSTTMAQNTDSVERHRGLGVLIEKMAT